MLKIIEITPQFSISPTPTRMGFREIVWSGYKTVINNAPDGEDTGVLSSAEGAAEAARCGMTYIHIPLTPLTMLDPAAADAMEKALASAPHPVLAHCRSGMLSAFVWAAAEMRRRPLAEVFASLDKAGIASEELREELGKLSEAAPTAAKTPSAP